MAVSEGSTDKIKAVANAKKNMEESSYAMQQYGDWDEFVVPLPTTIALMGQIMVVSSASDFPLDENPPEGGFKHIRWPKSFRACLLQVVHAAYDALNLAQKNMDQINQYTTKAPQSFGAIVRVLVQGDDLDVADLLPIELETIETIANECFALSQSVERQFNSSMDLISELEQCLINSQGTYEEKVKHAADQKEKLERDKRIAENHKKGLEEQVDRLKTAVENSEKQYQEARESLPGVWEIMAMDTVGSVCRGFKNMVSAVTAQSLFDMLQNYGQSQEQQGRGAAVADPHPVKTSESAVIQELPQLKTLASLLMEFDDLLQERSDKKMMENLEKSKPKLKGMKKQLGAVKKRLSPKPPSDARTEALGIIELAMDTCEQLTSMKNADDGTKSVLLSQIGANFEKAMTLSSKMSLATGTDVNDSPMQRMNSDAQSGSYSQMAMENAKINIEQSSARLKQVEDQLDSRSKELHKTNEEWSQLLSDLSAIDVEKIRFDEIIDVMKQATKALAAVRDKWIKISQFFQLMANLVKVNTTTVYPRFVSYAEKGAERRLDQITLSGVYKEEMYRLVWEAISVSHHVNLLASSYVEVSRVHVMPKLASLDNIMALDAKTDQQQIKHLQLQLERDCREAQDDIKMRLETKKNKFRSYIRSRRAEFEDTVKALEGPSTSRIATVARAAIEQGTKEAIEKEQEKRKRLEKEQEDSLINDFSF